MALACARIEWFASHREWACGAAWSALPWHGRGRRFDPDQVHQFLLDALHLHPPKRENQKVLYWLRVRSACSINRAPARADDFNAWPGAVGFGVSGTVRHISRGATPRAAAKELEIASFDSGIDRRLEHEKMSASRLAGKVVGSIPTRSTNSSLIHDKTRRGINL